MNFNALRQRRVLINRKSKESCLKANSYGTDDSFHSPQYDVLVLFYLTREMNRWCYCCATLKKIFDPFGFLVNRAVSYLLLKYCR